MWFMLKRNYLGEIEPYIDGLPFRLLIIVALSLKGV